MMFLEVVDVVEAAVVGHKVPVSPVVVDRILSDKCMT